MSCQFFSNTSTSQRLCMVSVVLGFVLTVQLFHGFSWSRSETADHLQDQMMAKRKLLNMDGGGSSSSRGDDVGDTGGGNGTMNRIETTCSKDNIVIFQGPTSPLPSGIPTFTVHVLNVCDSGCSISDIHFSCGWFSSARLINPSIFRRICYNDCLVNNGDALGPGGSLTFQYANSFPYPLQVSSIACD